MAKQLSRNKERYVPQQESYRNLPGLRAQADTVRTVATPVEADADAMKLNDIAEAFSAGNKALGDFLTMEKSFEETNRAENRVRAQMGLPPMEGKGHLDYGVDQGYEEGMGLLAGQSAMLELQQALEQEKYGVDEFKLGTVNDVRNHVDARANEVFNKYLADNPNQPFLEGATKYMAQAKLEARVKATEYYNGVKKKNQANAASAYINNDIKMYIKEVQDNGKALDPLALRQRLADLSAVGAPMYNMDRDTFSYIMLQNINDGLKTQMTSVLTNDGSLADIARAEDQAEMMFNAIQAPDANGIRLSDLNTPEVRDAVNSIRATVASFSGQADAIRTKARKLETDRVFNKAALMLNSGKDFSEVQKYISDGMAAGSVEGIVGITLLSKLQELDSKNLFSVVSETRKQELMSDAVSGRLTAQDAAAKAYDEKFPPDFRTTLFRAIDKRNSTVSTQRATANHSRMLASEDKRKDAVKDAEVLKGNKEALRQFYKLHPMVDQGTKSFVQQTLDKSFPDDGLPIDPWQLEAIGEDAIDTWTDLREKTQTEVTKADAVAAAQWRVIEKADRDRRNTLIRVKNIIADPRFEGTPQYREALGVRNSIYDYNKIIRAERLRQQKESTANGNTNRSWLNEKPTIRK